MNRREEKAIEIFTRTNKIHTHLPPDETRRIILALPACQNILEAMNWMADQCALEQRLLSPYRSDITEDELMAEVRNQYKYILNTGKEEA